MGLPTFRIASWLRDWMRADEDERSAEQTQRDRALLIVLAIAALIVMAMASVGD
jgi:hypothetical protein